MAQQSTEDLRKQANELLVAADATPKKLKALWQKLRAPEDRVLVQALYAKCRELVRKEAERLESQSAPDAPAVRDVVEFLKGFFDYRRARALLEKALLRELDKRNALGEARTPDAAAARNLPAILERYYESHDPKVATGEDTPHADDARAVFLKLAQQLALCTYKDEELHPEKRLQAALEILVSLRLRDSGCKVPETLGLGGAVYKRMWEQGGQIEHLRAALHFYRKGWRGAPAKDMGYCGVNAAFILDLLAHRARVESAREGTAADDARQHEADARALRDAMGAGLPGFPENWLGDKDGYWYKATLAEVFWGLEDWTSAADWLGRSADADHDEWARQTTAKQLVAIAAMRGILPPAGGAQRNEWHPAWQALHRLLGADTEAALTCHRGKVGLALSGGGFRASLFHLGVLARLAECDVLRSVEVLSTVSGGSIIGAHYYLELRHLLQTRTDAELTRDDYVELVRRVMDDFLAGVQMNLRTRGLASLVHNLRMLFSSTYTRSNRVGELYEEYLFSRVKDDHGGAHPRRLRDLLVRPLLGRASGGKPGDQDDAFKPKFSNWRRKSKVPILLLNTTSLNSGHNWHFTATWMGEPPGLLGDEVDMNERYRRLYYDEAPTEELRAFPVSYAVAASSCVPAMLAPLVLEGLYEERTVRLVDGGVHDNQGVAGLLDESCNFILCSDASGQMDDQASPADGVLSVFYRADSILQDRLREAQYQDLRSRAEGHALHGLFFIHLKQELETDPISWVRSTDAPPPTPRPTQTSYHVDREIQRLLSEVRTDLDTFTDVEAYALMASGYLLTTRQLELLEEDHAKSGLPGHWGGFDPLAPVRKDAAGRDYWPFMPLVPVLARAPKDSDEQRRDLGEQLRASKAMFGKVLKLYPALRAVALLVVIGLLIAAAAWLWMNRAEPLIKEGSWVAGLTVGYAALAAILLVAGLLWPFAKLLNPTSAARSLVVKFVLATFGWIATWIHLLIFEPLFKARGSLRRLLKLPGE